MKRFSGVGRMKTTMVSLMAGCIANIILDPMMIFGLTPSLLWESRGGFGYRHWQTLSFVIYLFVYRLRPIRVRLHWRISARARMVGGSTPSAFPPL